MADDPVARARDALHRAQLAAPDAAGTSILEAIDQLTQGLDRLLEAERNLAIQQALLDARLLRVERNRLFTAVNRIVSSGARLFARVRGGLPGRPVEEEEDPAAYVRWVAHESAALPSEEAARAVSNEWAQRPIISILMTVRTWESSAECLESLRRQAYGNWELCAAVNRGCESRFSGFPGKIRTVTADGIDDAQALNAAASLATGEYLAIVPERGVLSPLALYYIAEELHQGAFDLLYSDEDWLDAERRRVHPRFKPDWSPELLTSTMYLGNLLTIRRQSWLQAGGLSSEFGDACLFDLLLRLTDGPVRVHHVPRVLYHGFSRSAAAISDDAGRAIERAVERRERTAATCVPGPAAGMWMVRRKGAAAEMTAIICSRSPELLETCLASIRATAGRTVRQIVVVAHEERGRNAELHAVIERAGATALSFSGVFHFAAMNNLGAGLSEAANLLFLNDDVRATEAGWAELLAEHVSREEVGVAGAVLRYPTGVLQHAGVVVGIGDGVGHVGRYQRASRLWPWLLATRDVSAVTGACLAIRKEVFEKSGGFDRIFPNNYNDVDLCLRVGTQGYRVVCVPVPGLIHAECQSRPGVVRFEERYRFYERWAEVLRRPDPYYSRLLAAGERIELNAGGDDWYRGLMEDGGK